MRVLRFFAAVAALVPLVVMPALAARQAPRYGTPPFPSERVHGEAELGYMFHSDLYRYLADLNVWFDFGRWKNFVFFFDGGVLVYASTSDESSFQPDRLRGTLETGFYVPRNRNTYYFYVKHQSFHDIDTYDNQDESYEIYTLAYKYSGTTGFFVSVGKFENQTDVDYQWEFLGAIEQRRIGAWGKAIPYAAGTVRRVQEEENPTGRDGFTDYTTEIGVQTAPGLRWFVGYRQIHDINRFNGVTDHEGVIGVRYNW